LKADRIAAIAALTSGFAHEIGNPLGVIRGRAETLLTIDFEQSEVREDLEVIVGQTDDISRMVRTLLDVGRRRAGVRVTSDVGMIAAHTAQLVKGEAIRLHVTVIAHPGCQPLRVDCDPDQLQEVFVNLARNALDAMETSGGTLWINCAADEVQRTVRVSFQDTGPGVPAAICNQIFDPFFTSRPKHSAGTGLTISQSIIKDHDGELSCETNTHGACFVVRLPASRSHELEQLI